MSGRAYIFINFVQAARCGHIGWGFSLDDSTSFYFGSTDHLWRHPWWNLKEWYRYMCLPANEDNDWWAETGGETHMLNVMRNGHHIRYHAYKVVTVDDAYPDRARAAADALRLGGWSLAGNNCIDQTFRVISEFGGSEHLPAPGKTLLHMIPRRWFAAIPGQPRGL